MKLIIIITSFLIIASFDCHHKIAKKTVVPPYKNLISTYKKECNQIILRPQVESIIADLKSYDKKWLEVEGYYEAHMEKSALYLTSKHISSEALWISVNKDLNLPESKTKISFYKESEIEAVKNHSIRIIGFLDIGNKGHLGQYLGTIDSLCFVGILE